MRGTVGTLGRVGTQVIECKHVGTLPVFLECRGSCNSSMVNCPDWFVLGRVGRESSNVLRNNNLRKELSQVSQLSQLLGGATLDRD